LWIARWIQLVGLGVVVWIQLAGSGLGIVVWIQLVGSALGLQVWISRLGFRPLLRNWLGLIGWCLAIGNLRDVRNKRFLCQCDVKGASQCCGFPNFDDVN
jgi:hypothetical protein